MPIHELKEQGVLPNLRNQGKNKAVLLRSLLQFFGVASPKELETIYGEKPAAYRRSMSELSDPYATAAWLRLGELQAVSLACGRYDRQRFAAALHQIRGMTVLPPEEFEPTLQATVRNGGRRAGAGASHVSDPDQSAPPLGTQQTCDSVVVVRQNK